MRRISVMGYLVEIDDEKTAAWYCQSKPWGCECGPCRNFLKHAHSRTLPEWVLRHLDNFGISPEKATYVCDIYPEKYGYHYQFSYRIAGNILEENTIDNTGRIQDEGRCCHEPYPYGAPGFPVPHFDLEFWVTLPWILDE